jgi:hypothetical protein
MLLCQQCRDMLWDNLYDLLDEAENGELRAHLAGCPDCRLAFEQVRLHQQWLAGAARLEVDIPRFMAPKATAPAALLPPPQPNRPFWTSQILAYAATAAAVLLFLGLPTTLYWRARARLLAHQGEIEKNVEQLLARRDTIRRGQPGEEEEVSRSTTAHYVRLQVEGPSGYRPDRPIAFRIQASDMAGKPAGTVSVRVVDAARNVLFERIEPASANPVVVALPGTLDLDPRSAARLEITTSGAEQSDPVVTPIRIAPAYLAHLNVDRPGYLPGDRLYFSTRVLDRFDLHTCDRILPPLFTIKNSQNSGLASLQGSTNEAGIAGGVWQVPHGLPPGNYTLTVTDRQGRFAPVSRQFAVGISRETKLDAPESPGTIAAIPAPQAAPASLATIPKRVLEAGEALRVDLNSNVSGQKLLLRLVCRGKLAAQQRLTTTGGKSSLVLRPQPGASGLMHLTIYNEARGAQNKLADHLVYVVPGERLKLAIATDRPAYQPGAKVRLDLRSFNERGELEPSWLHICVVEKQAGNSRPSLPRPSLLAESFLLSELAPPVRPADADALVDETPPGRAALVKFLESHDFEGDRATVPQPGSSSSDDLVRLDNCGSVERKYKSALASALTAVRSRAGAELESLTSEGESQLGEIRQGLQELQKQRDLYVGALSLLLLISGGALIASGMARAGGVLARIRPHLAGAFAAAAAVALVAALTIEGIGPWAGKPVQPGLNQLEAQLHNPDLAPGMAMNDSPAPSKGPFIGVIQKSPATAHSLPPPETIVQSSGPTLVWAPAVYAKNGKALLTFELPEKHASYQVRVEAHSPSGRLGIHESVISSQ